MLLRRTSHSLKSGRPYSQPYLSLQHVSASPPCRRSSARPINPSSVATLVIESSLMSTPFTTVEHRGCARKTSTQLGSALPFPARARPLTSFICTSQLHGLDTHLVVPALLARLVDLSSAKVRSVSSASTACSQWSAYIDLLLLHVALLYQTRLLLSQRRRESRWIRTSCDHLVLGRCERAEGELLSLVLHGATALWSLLLL